MFYTVPELAAGHADVGVEDRHVLRVAVGVATLGERDEPPLVRALLLPRRRPRMRAPLWQQRKRAADLLGVAARYAWFPILLETYREVMRDVFDIPATVALLRADRLRQGSCGPPSIRRSPRLRLPRCFFSYIANYIYDGDAPLTGAGRRRSPSTRRSCRSWLGESDLRELLDAAALDESKRNCRPSIPRTRRGILMAYMTCCCASVI